MICCAYNSCISFVFSFLSFLSTFIKVFGTAKAPLASWLRHPWEGTKINRNVYTCRDGGSTWTKNSKFKILIGTIIVWLRFFSNGRTNLPLLLPTLTSKTADAEENCKPRVLEKNILFGCDRIYFPKIKCDCK